MRRPELLIPTGDLETLKIAVRYGADAVYLGGEDFSLRAKAKNFSMQELKEGIAFAHAHGVKVYVAVNIFAHNEELGRIRVFFAQLKELGPDALIVSDVGVLMLVKEILPDVEIHISTQWSNSNYETFQFWHRMGAKKVVAARELTLEEIKEIRRSIPDELQIECFIHGAMCVACSGKCQLSNYFTGRDGNHGECTHPCRWNYAVRESGTDGTARQIEDGYAHILNSKDLCMVGYLPELFDAGIDSFKIEGRMKTILYVATVARTYRMAIDDFIKDPECYRENRDRYLDEISKCTYREYSTGFFFGQPDDALQIYGHNTYLKNYTYLGYVERVGENGDVFITQKNKFCVGDEIEVMKPDGRNLFVRVKAIWDENGTAMESAPHPKQKLRLDLGVPTETYDVLRQKSGPSFSE